MSEEFIKVEQRQLLLQQRLLVIDLELTCGPGVTHGTQDIIEVGACVLERGVPATESPAVSVYVRPERSAVNKFCTMLTGITPARVANEPNFAAMVPRLKQLADNSGATTWVSWGQDQTLLHRQCVASGVDNPFDGLEHVDIKRLLTPLVYQLTGGEKPKGAGSGVGLATAMKQLGLWFHGRAHSGAFDAMNTARLVEELQRLAEPHLKATAAHQDAKRQARRARP